MKKTILLLSLLLSLTAITCQAQHAPSDSTTLNEEVFDFVEQEAQFPGGEDSMMHFLMNHVRYPNEAREKGIRGRVVCSFTVTKNGNIVNIKIVKGIRGGCNESAMKAIKMMPNWIPGKIDGKAVNSKFVIPIVFTM